MTMPYNLVLVRHGESEGNVAMAAAREGDTSLFHTEKYVNTPGRKWDLSEAGVAQARAIGAWLNGQEELGAFGPKTRIRPAEQSCGCGRTLDETPVSARRYYVSPLTRTRHTAGHMGLVATELWRLNRTLRERDWGDIESMDKTLYREIYKDSAHKERIDPLYWRPPGGESIADVVDRMLNFYDTLHRECGGMTVYATIHGETIRANLLALTRANDEDYWIWDEGFPTREKFEEDPALAYAAPTLDYTSDLANLFGGKLKISNCTAVHISRFAPDEDQAGEPSQSRMAYLRIAAPVQLASGEWATEVKQDWTEFEAKLFTDADLLSF